jgi:choice-of-anchor B domain-containing protein
MNLKGRRFMIRRYVPNGLLLIGVIGFALSVLFSLSAQAGDITLVGQIDPIKGVDKYSDIWGEGDYAYLGAYSGRKVSILDVSDPANPSLVSFYAPATGSGAFHDVKVYNGIGYFADDAGDGMHIVDVSDPANPTLLAIIRSTDSGFDNIHNSSVHENYLYMVNNSSTIKVFDMISPASPIFVRDILTPNSGAIHDVTPLGTRLYASDIRRGLTYIYDITSIGSSAAILLAEVPTGSRAHSSWATSDGTILVSAQEKSDGNVVIFDISNLAAPVLLSTMDRTSLGLGSEVLSPHNPVLFSDTLLFISWYEAGVVAIDISDPSNPVKIGQYDTWDNNAFFGYDGNWGVYPFFGLDRVLLSDEQNGLFVVDATALVCGNGTLDPVEECDDGNSEAGDGCSATCQIEGEDTDGDGVPDEDDACPNSILDPTVVIDGCDSQVSNALLSEGCTISDEVDECAANSRKHGAFRRCVSKLGDGLQKDGVLTGPEKDQILSCAGQADIP